MSTLPPGPSACPAPEPTLSPNNGCIPFTDVAHAEQLTDGDSWTSGSSTQSVTILARAVDSPGSATLTTIDGTVDLVEGDTFTFSVIRDQDDHVEGVEVNTSDPDDDVLVIWTEAV